MTRIGESELIINPDGSIFHLHLKPEDIADDIILVGDQGRVEMVSSFFDSIELKKHNREFVTHTGYYKGKRISVISTGIGTDNIDIVLNELDAIVNVDLKTRTVKENRKALNLVRIGTSGSLQEDLPVDTPVLSEISIGFDGMLNYYRDRNKVVDLEAERLFCKHTDWNKLLTAPYFVRSSEELNNKIGKGIRRGITVSAAGFYGPQGRELRLPVVDPSLNEKLGKFEYADLKITNYEMESSALAGLAALLGHNATTVCCIIANRMRKEYSKDYKIAVKELVSLILDRLV